MPEHALKHKHIYKRHTFVVVIYDDYKCLFNDTILVKVDVLHIITSVDVCAVPDKIQIYKYIGVADKLN